MSLTVRREFPEVEVVVAATNDYLFSLNPVVAGCAEADRGHLEQ